MEQPRSRIRTEHSGSTWKTKATIQKLRLCLSEGGERIRKI